MTTQNGFISPNYTQAPNEWFDNLLPLMGYAETKVSAAIIRQTLGWHKTRCECGLARLAKLTGLSERHVIVGAEQAEARGYIRRLNKGSGKRQRTIWELVITTSLGEAVEPVSTSLGEVELPPLGRQTTSPREGRKRNNKEIEKTTTTNKAAAVGEWQLGGLIVSSKLGKAKRAEIEQAHPAPSAGAFVSKYLYAVAHEGFRSPALWAASQVLAAPGQWEGEPYESLAGEGPTGLAEIFDWVLSDGARPLNGSLPLALALRGDLQARNGKDTGRIYRQVEEAIGDLGLRQYMSKPAASEPSELVSPEPASVPAALDAWEAIIERGRSSREFSGAALERLSRCVLVSEKAGRLVVAVPTVHEFDWLQKMLGKTLTARFAVSLVKAEQ